MSFSGGVFSLVAGNPVVTGTTISSTVQNNTLSDIATGLSTCILKDGSQTVTADIPMSGFKITGLGAATATGDAIAQNKTVNGLLDISGSLAGQIKFPATQNASADVNTLDDYEEGTWTPAIGGSATYTTQTATYTKVGRLVFIKCRLTINAVGTGSATTISGLPFTAKAGADYALAVSFFANIATASTCLMANVLSATTTITFNNTASAVSSASATTSVFQNSADVIFAGCYEV